MYSLSITLFLHYKFELKSGVVQLMLVLDHGPLEHILVPDDPIECDICLWSQHSSIKKSHSWNNQILNMDKIKIGYFSPPTHLSQYLVRNFNYLRSRVVDSNCKASVKELKNWGYGSFPISFLWIQGIGFVWLERAHLSEQAHVLE